MKADLTADFLERDFLRLHKPVKRSRADPKIGGDFVNRENMLHRKKENWPTRDPFLVSNHPVCDIAQMISDLVAIMVWWNALQSFPGIAAFGYFYGFVAAVFAIEALETLNRPKSRNGN